MGSPKEHEAFQFKILWNLFIEKKYIKTTFLTSCVFAHRCVYMYEIWLAWWGEGGGWGAGGTSQASVFCARLKLPNLYAGLEPENDSCVK